MNKIVIERAEEAICPICKQGLEENSKIEEYNGKKVFICKHHKIRRLNE